MRMTGPVAALAAALITCGPALAASGWASHGELGLVMAHGVTSTESGDLKLDAAHAIGRWTYGGGLAALYASTNHMSTQQDLNVHLQVERALGRRTFWFGTGRYDRNLFNGFAYQESLATGLGRVLVQSRPTRLSAELGAGVRREQPELLATNSLGAVISRTRRPVVAEAVLHAALQFSRAISRSTTLKNQLLVESGSSDTMTSDNLSLQVKMNRVLSLAIGMQLVNNTSPPPGDARHTDTVMTVNLVYDLKNPKLSAGTSSPDLFSSLNMP